MRASQFVVVVRQCLHVVLLCDIVFVQFYCVISPLCDPVMLHRLHAILLCCIVFVRFCYVASPSWDSVVNAASVAFFFI
jgi:hypothetical protein